VLDVLVPEVVLQRPRVLAIIGELEPAGVTQHVWMHEERKLGLLAGPRSPSEKSVQHAGSV